MKRVALAALFALAVLGCSDPKSVVIPSDPEKWEQGLQEAAKKLSEDERAALGAYVMRMKASEVLAGGAGIPPGTTIGDALKAQADFEAKRAKEQAEAEALRVRVEKERAQAQEQMRKAVAAAVTKLELVGADFSERRITDEQVIQVALENKSDKVIAGVSGAMRFFDMFDREAGVISFAIQEDIAPGKTVLWTGARRYNQYEADHKAIAQLAPGKFKAVFEPDVVVFADGTKLKAPE